MEFESVLTSVDCGSSLCLELPAYLQTGKCSHKSFLLLSIHYPYTDESCTVYAGMSSTTKAEFHHGASMATEGVLLDFPCSLVEPSALATAQQWVSLTANLSAIRISGELGTETFTIQSTAREFIHKEPTAHAKACGCSSCPRDSTRLARPLKHRLQVSGNACDWILFVWKANRCCREDKKGPRTKSQTQTRPTNHPSNCDSKPTNNTQPSPPHHHQNARNHL